MPVPSNTRLSPHFTAAELRADDPAATSAIVANLQEVADFLELVRTAVGAPLRVTSGFRSPEYNAKVGGVPSSSHQDGRAADVVPLGPITMYQAYKRLQDAGLPSFDQIIYYPIQGHIHIGLGAKRRREVRVRLSPDPGGTPLLVGDLIARLPGFPVPGTPAASMAPLVVLAVLVVGGYLLTA